VNAVRVQDDQSVVRGQVIAELNAEDLRGKQSELNLNRKALGQQEQAIILQNRAAVEAASEDVEKAEAALRLAESEFSRYSQLADSGAIASIQLDEKRANLEVAKSNVEKARQSVKELVSQRQRDLSRLSQEVSTNLQESEKVKRDLGITLVRSPVSGVIHSLALRNPAQVVVEGQELARVAPVNREILAKVFIPAESIDDIEIGQTADLRIIGCPFPDFGTMKGRVVSISPDAVSAQTAQQIQPSPSSSAQATESHPRYEVTVQPSGRTLESGSRKCELKLGMDFEADITTRIETVMTFLLRKARLIAGR
jgi:multidrug resistance efflux pump